MNRTIIGISAIVLALIVGVFVLRPKIADVRQVTIDKKVSLERVKQKEARLEALNSLSTAFANQPAEVEGIIRSLPTEPEIPDVLVTIEAMTRDSGLSLDALSPSIDKTKQLVSVSLNGTADLAALERFYQAVSENRRPMSMSQVTMTKSQTSNALNYNFVVSFAYITQSSSTASPTAEAGTGNNRTSPE